MDGPARRRQRPQDAAQQQSPYRGKQQAHTDKNLLLVTDHTGTVVYRGPTRAGKTHDKKAAAAAALTFPARAPLGKDPGFQGYEPAGVLTMQPKKSPAVRS